MHRNTQREYILKAMHPLLSDRKTHTHTEISKETYWCCWNDTTPYTCLIILHTKKPNHDDKIKSTLLELPTLMLQHIQNTSELFLSILAFSCLHWCFCFCAIAKDIFVAWFCTSEHVYFHISSTSNAYDATYKGYKRAFALYSGFCFFTLQLLLLRKCERHIYRMILH